jgi:tetratricopeptide (TPR) repeat protein
MKRNSQMRPAANVLGALLLGLCFALPVQAQEYPLDDLFGQMFKLHDQGRFSEAIEVAERALEVAEATFGADHPNAGISLNNLAYLLDLQGQWSISHLLYARALTILEKGLGRDHERVGIILRNMVDCCRRLGKYREADELEARAEGIETGGQADEEGCPTP